MTSLPVQPTLGVTAPPIPSSNAVAEAVHNESVVEKFRALPPVLPVYTPERVPKKARRRIGKLMITLVNELMGMLPDAQAGPVRDASEHVQLCKYAYVLVARRASETEKEKHEPARESKQWKMMRRRLQLAEAGKWNVLLDDLIADVKASVSRQDEERFTVIQPEQQDHGEWKRRGLAIRKVKLNCARTAAQLLKGQSLQPACSATAEAQKAQLVLDQDEVD